MPVALAARDFLPALQRAARLAETPQRLQQHAQLQVGGEIVRHLRKQRLELRGRALLVAAPLSSSASA